MIRAPNQLSPKTKVVDLLFLYNFYFGQISCSHMEFGVSASQFKVKIIQTKKQCLHCARLRTGLSAIVILEYSSLIEILLDSLSGYTVLSAQ